MQHVTAMSIKIIAVITSYDDGLLCGVLDSIYYKEPFVFSGELEMIEMMETTFDATGFPDKQLLPRTFGKAKQRMRRQEMDLNKQMEKIKAGKAQTNASDAVASVDAVAIDADISDTSGGDHSSPRVLGTFEILVRFRHNAEWQGKLHWVERGVTKQFHSVIDIAKLLDEALTA